MTGKAWQLELVTAPSVRKLEDANAKVQHSLDVSFWDPQHAAQN